MKSEIFTIKYVDKATAAIVFKKINELELENEKITSDLGILAYGIERNRSSSRRTRTFLKLSIVLAKEKAQNLPSILKVIHDSLRDHPLFPYLSLDYTAVPMSQTEWNFDSYDDPNYQKIFIQKRTKG